MKHLLRGALLLTLAHSACAELLHEKENVVSQEEILQETLPPTIATNKQLVTIIELLRQLQLMVLGKDESADATLADILKRLYNEPYNIKMLAGILPSLKAVINQLGKIPGTEFARPYYEAIKDAVITSINTLYKNGNASQSDIQSTTEI